MGLQDELNSMREQSMARIPKETASIMPAAMGPEILRPVYANWGINLPAANGDDSFKLPIPATYIIDTNKNIILDFIEINHTKRLEPSYIIDAIKDLSG